MIQINRYCHSRLLRPKKLLSFGFSRSFYDINNPNFRTLVELQQKSCAANKDIPLFGTRIGKEFKWTTYGEFGAMVDKFRNVLLHHNIGYNDKVKSSLFSFPVKLRQHMLNDL